MMPVDPLQARPGWVAYMHGDDTFFNYEEGADNVPNDGPHFTSAELEQLTTEQLPAVIAAKRAFGGRITHVA